MPMPLVRASKAHLLVLVSLDTAEMALIVLVC